MVGLTSLLTREPPMLPKLNRKRALFVMAKIDEILAWEQRKEAERDTRFVELGRYLCEVRAGQYWRLENLKSFDEFLERRFPESRRKAYYLMSIHEHLPPQVRKDLKEIGWTKGRELAKLARAEGQRFDCAPWVHKARSMPREDFRREVEKELTGTGRRAVGADLLQSLQEPDPGDRAGDRYGGSDAGDGQIAWLLSGDDLRGLSGGGEPGERQPRDLAEFDDSVLQVPTRGTAPRFSRKPAREGLLRMTRPSRLDPMSYESLRQQILCRDSWRCQSCGTMSNLEVHHQQFRSHSGNDSEENLITLCATCHFMAHHPGNETHRPGARRKERSSTIK